MEPIFVIGSINSYLGNSQKLSTTANFLKAIAKFLTATAKNYE